MKNTTLLAIVIIIIIAGGFFIFNGSASSTSSTSQSNSVQVQQSGDIQKITLSMQNYNYYPNTIKVKVNQPVEITLDSSVKGCYRSFTIKALGLGKYLSTPNDKLTFTPTEKGTFQFACSMGMGRGTLIVE